MWYIYIASLLAVASYCFYNRFFHPLRKVPGPFLASISPLWIAWQSWKCRRPRLDVDLHKKYGSIVRISPDEIIFSNADYYRQVYGAGTTFTKGRFYEATGYNPHGKWEHLDMLTEHDIPKLRVQKRFAGPVYTIANMTRHEQLVDNNITRCMNRLRELSARDPRIANMYQEMELFAIDTLCEVTFGQGQAFGAVERGSDGGHTASMDRMWRWWSWLGHMPWLNWLDKNISPWQKYWTTSIMNVPVFPYVLGKLVEYEKSLGQEKQDMRPCLLHDLKERAKEQEVFHTNWATELARTDLGAGVDTISWTLITVIVGVAQNPEVQARVHQELDDAGELEDPGREPIAYGKTTKLPYLQACIEEAMRLWPTLAISVPRIVSKGGIEIDGYFVPEGFTVGMNSKVLGHNEKVFGADPEKFRPERWLRASKTQKDTMTTRNLGFGAASRKCPGQYLALFVMSKTLATLFTAFNVKLLNELDGVPGLGGHVWREEGTFPTKWHGVEVELTAR